MNQWQPEREIGLDDAVALIRTQCPEVEFDQARYLAAGWDNTVVELDTGWIFRFPRRKIALPGVLREIEWLPSIAERVGLAIPVPAYVGDYDGWPFWGGRHLTGEELARSPDADRIPIVGLPVDPFGRADSATRSIRARDVLNDLAGLGLWSGDRTVDRVLADGERLGPSDGPLALSHGDLYSRHVLVGPEPTDGARVSGIIDWGDLCMASPAVDLAIAFSAFSGDSRTALFEAYGPVDEQTALRAQTFAVFSAASIAHYAHDTADPVLLADALTGLANI